MDETLARIVGERIRRMRIQSGFSLREQARILGISASSLSALENVIKALSLAPERRKALIYVSVGLDITVNPTNDAMNLDGTTSTNFEDPGGVRARQFLTMDSEGIR